MVDFSVLVQWYQIAHLAHCLRPAITHFKELSDRGLQPFVLSLMAKVERATLTALHTFGVEFREWRVACDKQEFPSPPVSK